jgi:hypothetical protein
LPLAAARGALPVELEVAVVRDAPLGAMQEWGKLLSEMDLARLRLRGATAADKPSVTPVGEGAGQRFRVVGVLNQRDQLILPGGAFGQGDAARLKEFFQALPERVADQGVERGIFGLTQAEFERLYDDLSRPVESAAAGSRPDAVVQAIQSTLHTQLQVDDQARAALAASKPIAVDLKGFSAGTALAIVLRGAGLELQIVHARGNPLTLRAARATREPDHWPAGWKPDDTPRATVPAMYRVTTIEISGYTLEKALEGLAPHMGAPLVFDQRVLAERGIDPAKVDVKFPETRTYIRRAIDHILAQARLAGELRIDEAGRPFYWITQFGPDSPRALGADPATTPPAP